MHIAQNWIDIIENRVAESADQLAYRFLIDGKDQPEQTITYGELFHRAAAMAAVLQARVAAGDRALVVCPPGIDFITALLGCILANVVAVPAYPPRAGRQDRLANRLRGIILDCQPRIALTSSANDEDFRQSLRDIESDIATLACDTVAATEASAWKRPEISPDTITGLQYTSGSTGDPRGVRLTHANLLHNCRAIYSAFGHDKQSIGVIWLPPYHDMGLIGGVFQPLFGGFEVSLMSPQSFLTQPIRWLSAISKFHATTSGGPDFAYGLCARSITPAQCEGLDLSSWRVAFNGAEPVRAETMQAFSHAFAPYGFDSRAFYPCYGLAESTLLVSGGTHFSKFTTKNVRLNADAKSDRQLVSAGSAKGGAEIRICPPQSDVPCAAGAIGEIQLRGPSVSAGYWREDRKVFGTDGWLRTGDLGLLDDGELYITGRLKELIIIRGANHYPHDIERTVQQAHPALNNAPGAAVSFERDGCESLGIVHEVQRSHRNANTDEVIAAICAAVAAEHEIEVSAIALLKPGQLPRTSSGKTQRLVCRDRLAERGFEALADWLKPQEAPATLSSTSSPPDPENLCHWLAQKVARRAGLAVEMIDPLQPLARYGLGSVDAVGLAGEISNEMGIDFPATLLWDYPSVELLAEYLRAGAPADGVGVQA